MNEQALWAAVRARPADDVGWLALADWLEERGRPEAEYVRLFVAAAAGPAEADFRRAWKRLKMLRRSLPAGWLESFCSAWADRPLQLRIAGSSRLGTYPLVEMFDRALSSIFGQLVSGTIRRGQPVLLPLANGGAITRRVCDLVIGDESPSAVRSGAYLGTVGLVWSGHEVAELGVAVGGTVRSADDA
jgi:uncharacterized protein (TIGR02996 family)